MKAALSTILGLAITATIIGLVFTWGKAVTNTAQSSVGSSITTQTSTLNGGN